MRYEIFEGDTPSFGTSVYTVEDTPAPQASAYAVEEVLCPCLNMLTKNEFLSQ